MPAMSEEIWTLKDDFFHSHFSAIKFLSPIVRHFSWPKSSYVIFPQLKQCLHCTSVNYNIVAGRMFCGKLTSFQLWWRHVRFIGSLVYSTIRVCDGNLFTRLQHYQDGCKQTLPSVTFSVWLVVTISWPQWDRAEGMFGFVVTVIVMWNIRYILLIFLYTIGFFCVFFPLLSCG